MSNTFKEKILKIVNKLFLNSRDNSKYVYLKAMKEIKQSNIENLAQLKQVKFVGGKIFEKIKDKLEGMGYKEEYKEEEKKNDSFKMTGSIREIIGDFNKLSSNLSEMELKYAENNDEKRDDLDILLNDSFSFTNSDEHSIQEVEFEKKHEDFGELDFTMEFTQPTQHTQSKEEAKYEEEIDLTKFSSCNDDQTNNSLSKINTSLSNIKIPPNIISSIDVEHKTFEQKQVNRMDDIIIINTDEISKSQSDLKKAQKLINKEKSKRRRNSYVPMYKSAAYAIIMCLHNYPNGMHKNMVVLNAGAYTATEFDKSKKFSGYNAFKTLIQKGLIYEEDKKYFLTNTGQELSVKLSNANMSHIASQSMLETNEILKQNVFKEDNVTYLVIDSRERSNRDFLFFQQKFIDTNFTTRQLELGDFIWIKNEFVLNCIVERKEANDFVASTVDGRYLEQKHRMTKLSGFNTFYIIENKKQIQSKRILGEITKMKINLKNEKFTVVETNNINQTVAFLKQLHLHIQNNNHRISQENCLTYGEFTETASKKHAYGPKETFLYLLLKIRGITREKARVIIEKYKNIKTFIKAMENKEKFVKECACIKIDLGEQKGHKEIGKVMSQKIYEMMK